MNGCAVGELVLGINNTGESDRITVGSVVITDNEG